MRSFLRLKNLKIVDYYITHVKFEVIGYEYKKDIQGDIAVTN